MGKVTPTDQASSALSHLDGETRLRAVRWIITGGFLAGFALAPRLWIATRAYPVTPMLPLPAWPFPLDYIAFGMLIGLLVVAAVMPNARWPLLGFFGLLVALIAADLMRLQPWIYMYGFLALVLGVQRDAERALNTSRLVMVCMYFWSGTHKLNSSFIHEGLPYFLGALLPLDQLYGLPVILGWLAPFMEAGAGLGLLVGRLRYPAIGVQLAMHAFILVALGPVGRASNTIVWPWNITMALLLLVLFARVPEQRWRDVLLPGRSFVHCLALVLFGFLPFLHRFDRWDLYLSSSLYSGMNSYAWVVMSADVVPDMPPDIQPHLHPQSGDYLLNLYAWTMAELNVPPYPERRFYRAMARHFRALASDPDGVFLLVQERPDTWTGQRKLIYLRGTELD